MQEEMITITLEKYLQMQSDQNFLNCLTACGVDNWEGFGEAQDMFEATFSE
jgi:hypothetical protein